MSFRKDLANHNGRLSASMSIDRLPVLLVVWSFAVIVESMLTTQAWSQIVHQGSRTGVSSNSATVATSASLLGVKDHLYLATISARPKTSVASVSGLGLTWSLVKSKCAGRNTTGIEVWMAQGTPTVNGAVTATFVNAPITAVIVASRYAGVAALNPIGNVIAGNSNGLNSKGACVNGIDNNSYSFPLSTTVPNAVIYSAVAIKGRKHTPGVGFAERAEIQQLNGTSICGAAVVDKMIASPSSVTVEGAFNNNVDWVLVALEIRPKSTESFTLSLNKTGYGNVELNPPGGLYLAGTTVTLLAKPDTGFRFSYWGGNLSGFVNPAKIIVDGNKIVQANFGLRPQEIIHEETITGNVIQSATVTTSTNFTGAKGDFYLAAVSTEPRAQVISLAGLGLNWKLVKSRCSGRGTTGVEVWMAHGPVSGNATVAAAFTGVPSTAVIAVSRYSGVTTSFPLGNAITANSTGSHGTAVCSGGIDNGAYSVGFNTYEISPFIYCAVAVKEKMFTPGLGYIERAEIHRSNGMNNAGLAVADKSVTASTTVSVNGSFSGTLDWALVVVEIRPQIIIPTGYYSLTAKYEGPCGGYIYVNPPQGPYRSGETVTVIATPLALCYFGGWGGDLSGSANPATIVMNGNKTVTAAFFVGGLIVKDKIETASTENKRGMITDNDKFAVTPATYQLEQNFPNPFNAQSVIEYSLPQASPVRLVVYSATGQIVRRLIDENQITGRHRAVWNGENDFGVKVSSGVYFYQLEVGTEKLTRKMILQQ